MKFLSNINRHLKKIALFTIEWSTGWKSSLEIYLFIRLPANATPLM